MICAHTHTHTHSVWGRTPHESKNKGSKLKKKKRAKGAQIAGERSEIWSAIAFTNANVSAAFAFSHSAVESVHILLFFGGPNSPSGRTAGWLDGQRTDGRTDWTDGQAAASTALSTPQSPMLSTLDFRPGVRMPSMAFEFRFFSPHSLVILIRLLLMLTICYMLCGPLCRYIGSCLIGTKIWFMAFCTFVAFLPPLQFFHQLPRRL